MSDSSKNAKLAILFATFVIVSPGSLLAQQGTPTSDKDNIIVTGQAEAPEDVPEAATPAAPAGKGPDIKGIISARTADRLQITTDDGTKTIVTLTDATKIKARKGFFGLDRKTLAGNSLLNGLPVTIKTLQSGSALVASEINVRGTDLKTAAMIHTGTEQGFAEQTAATAALRGRMADIDQYNVKGTTNVNFDTGKAVLSAQGKVDLCAAATAAEGTKNALLLVVGYTDSTGGDEFNQQLSERRASRVVNYIQQNCGWKPYRMLTPTGMAKADPLADNNTVEGKAQNRRVAVNILVSKGLDGL
jgi:OmpA-OmpF porin, OOP family